MKHMHTTTGFSWSPEPASTQWDNSHETRHPLVLRASQLSLAIADQPRSHLTMLYIVTNKHAMSYTHTIAPRIIRATGLVPQQECMKAPLPLNPLW